jgi:hypothetical protein
MADLLAPPQGRAYTADEKARMLAEAKRRALDEIAARKRAADERREQDAARQQQAATVSQAVVVQ